MEIEVPYVDQKHFKLPTNGQRLFRYMNTSKFLSMITSGSLFFPSVGKLRASDPFEGGAGLVNYLMLSADWNLLPEEGKNYFRNDEKFYNLYRLGQLKGYSADSSYSRETIFVNCWHASEYESDAMWRVYSELSEGIAIVTNIDRMKSAIVDESHSVYIGFVDYIDQRVERINDAHYLKRVMWKRHEFSHEREVRLVTSNMDNIEFYRDGTEPNIKDKNRNFVTVDVDLNCLIEAIIFNPRSETWYRKAIIKTIEAVGFSWAVMPSSFEESPPSPTDMIQQLREQHRL